MTIDFVKSWNYNTLFRRFKLDRQDLYGIQEIQNLISNYHKNISFVYPDYVSELFLDMFFNNKSYLEIVNLPAKSNYTVLPIECRVRQRRLKRF